VNIEEGFKIIHKKRKCVMQAYPSRVNIEEGFKIIHKKRKCVMQAYPSRVKK